MYTCTEAILTALCFPGGHGTTIEYVLRTVSPHSVWSQTVESILSVFSPDLICVLECLIESDSTSKRDDANAADRRWLMAHDPADSLIDTMGVCGERKSSRPASPGTYWMAVGNRD